jgi:acetylornithine deacetylase/succinyl-diaminopimelate desuccinylase-like protein
VSRATGAGSTGVRRADPVALTQALTRIDSRNPSLVPGAPGESAIAHRLADILSDWGFSVELPEVEPGRPNLVARIGPAGTPGLTPKYVEIGFSAAAPLT